MMLSSTIPVRGRKLVQCKTQIRLNGTIPVRGRKQHCCCVDGCSCSTIPVRGRKRIWAIPYRVHACTIPVRGRKRVQVLGNPIHVSTIPVRGQKLLCHAIKVFVPDFNFSPQNPLRRCAPALPKGELLQLLLLCTKLPLSGELARRKP